MSTTGSETAMAVPAGTRPGTAIVNNLTKAHYLPLDGLRGMAILLVVIYHFGRSHAGAHDPEPGLLLGFTQFGWMGVDLFFVLSGFLITGILLETRGQEGYFRNFLARRFLRIWPLYYLNLIVFFIVMPAVLGSMPGELQSMESKQAWFWLYAANWLFAREGSFEQTSGGYFWSLAVEEQFYLFWPIVVYMLSQTRLLQVCVALFVSSLVLRIVVLSLGVSTSTAYAMTFTHLDGLALGAALSICLRSPDLTVHVRRLAKPAVLVGLAAVAAVRIADGNFLFWSRNMALFGYSAVAVVFAGLLVWALQARPGSVQHSFLTSRFMVATGRYSYALYLAHVPVASVVYALVVGERSLQDPFAYNVRFAAFALAAFAVSWGASFASWHLLEKRLLGLKRYFAYS